MKVTVVFVLCIAAIFAAPAIDEDGRIFENRNSGDINGVEEHIPAKSRETALLPVFPTIEEIKRINKICMEETKTDKKIVDMVLINQIIPTDPQYRKFLACSYRKQKYLNDRGQIQFQNIINFLSRYYKKDDLKVLEVCGEIKQTNNGGDNAYNVLQCILPKLYLLKEIFDE